MVFTDADFNRLLESLSLAERFESTSSSYRRWRDLAQEATSALTDVRKELDSAKSEIELLKDELRSSIANSNRLSNQLQDLGSGNRGRTSRCSSFHAERERSQSRSRSRATERSTSRPGGMRRRSSSGGRNVHFQSPDPASARRSGDGRHESIGANMGRERRPRGYHLTAEELRRRAEAEAKARFNEERMDEFCKERDRMDERFELKKRGAPNVQVRGTRRWVRGDVFGGRPHGQHPPPPPPPPPPIPGTPHDIPSPGDPLAHPELMKPRRNALPTELFDFVMRGGRDRDVFGRPR
ncbi:hypothetical protein PWT90_03697 [Aphanocladium album]|nr:hypothetical protein PWT90_03697 [Aphanocladium album]